MTAKQLLDAGKVREAEAVSARTSAITLPTSGNALSV